MANGLTKIDAKLLDLADRGASGEEMYEETNIPATQAILRVRELLAQRDWLSDLERQKMNIMALQQVKNSLLQRVKKSNADKDDIDVFVKATKVMDELLDKANTITEEQLTTITTRQAQALMTLMTTAWDAAVRELEERYPQVETKEITDVFHNGLRQGARELQVDVE